MFALSFEENSLQRKPHRLGLRCLCSRRRIWSFRSGRNLSFQAGRKSRATHQHQHPIGHAGGIFARHYSGGQEQTTSELRLEGLVIGYLFYCFCLLLFAY